MIDSLRRALWFQGIVLLGLFYIIYLSLKSLVLVPNDPTLSKANQLVSQFDYRGSVNVHTSASGGTLPVDELITAAQNAGLDWIFISDLNTGVPVQLQEGRNRTLLIMAAAKFDYLGGRVIALNPERLAHPESLGQAQTTIADILSEPPLVSLTDLLVFETAPHIQSNVYQMSVERGFGEEVINLRSFLLNRWALAPLSTLWSLMIYPFNFPLALLRLMADLELNYPLWDSRWRSSAAVGLIGHDVIPTQSELGLDNDIEGQADIFRFASVHVITTSELTGDFQLDRNKLLKSLAARQSYIAFDALGPTTGFRFHHEASQEPNRINEDQLSLMGAKVPWRNRGRFVISIPRRPELPFEVVLIRDGQAVMTSNSEQSSFTVSEPGVYRVIVRLFTALSVFDGRRWVPWILTNPIEIQPD